MASTWGEIRQDPDFQALSPQDQAKAKRGYFQRVVSPDPTYRKLTPPQRREVGRRFFQEELDVPPAFAERVKTGALRAITPFEGPRRILTERVAPNVPQIPGLEPTGARGPLGVGLETAKRSLRLALPGHAVTPKTGAELLAPTPLDVVTLGLTGGLKAAQSLVSKLGLKAFSKAPKIAKTVKQAVQKASSIEEATARLEAAAAKAPKPTSPLAITTAGPIPDKVLGANISKLSTSDDAARLIVDVSKTHAGEIDGARRGVITLAEQAKLADTLGMTPRQLMKRRKGVAFNAEQSIASRQVLVQSAERTVEAARAAVSGRLPMNEAIDALGQHVSVQAQAAGIRAEAGRALGSFRKGVGGNISKAIRAFLKSHGGEDVSREMIERLAKMDPSDPASVNRFIRDTVEGTFGDNVFEAWVNGLLSSLQTHVVNATSNSLTLLMRPLAERPVAAGLEMLRAGVTGTQRQRFMGEAFADIFGIVRGIPEGATNAVRTFVDEIPRFANTKIETGFAPRESIKGPFGKLIRLPGRALIAADDFFKTIARSGEINALAYRDAVKKGLTGEERVRHINGILTRRVPGADALWKKAKKEAFYRTFTAELGESGKSIERLRATLPGAKVIVPFLRTPINIAKFGLERTPLNFLRLAHQNKLKDILNKPALMDELAKPVIGSLIGAAAAWGVAAGRVTGGGPENPDQRRVLRASGWQPYSILIDEQYFSYGRMEPMAITFGLAADFAELNDVVDNEEAVSKISLAIARNLSSKTFLTGVSDFLDAISDPERYGRRWVQRFSGSVVPTGVAAVARAQHGFRDPRTIRESIKARIPGWAETVPVLRDIWGEPIVIPGFEVGGVPVERIVSPIYRSGVRNEPASQEMIRLGLKMGSARRMTAGLEMTPVEADNFIRMSGRAAKRNVDAVISTDEYRSAPDFAQAEMLRKAINLGRQEARDRTGITEMMSRARAKKRGGQR